MKASIIATAILTAALALLPFSIALADSYRDCLSGTASADRRISGCKAILERGPQKNGKDLAAARLNLGVAYLKKRRLEEAIAEFGALIKADPGHALAHYYRGRAYLNKKETGRALQDFDAAIRLGVGPEQRRHIHEMRGQKFYDDGRFDAAIAELDAAIALNPGMIPVYNLRGLAYLKKGEPARAIEDFDTVIVRSGTRSDNIAIAARNFREKAAETLRAAGKPVPPPPGPPDEPKTESASGPITDPAQLKQALAACTDGNRAGMEVEQACTAVIGSPVATDDDKFAAYISRSRASIGRRAYGGSRYVEILPNLDEALRLRPDSSEAHYLRGRVYAERKQFDRALQDFDAALKLDPNETRSLYWRGVMHKVSEQFEHAVKDFDAVIGVEPGHAWAHLNRAQAHSALGQYEKALADFDKALSLAGSDKWLSKFASEEKAKTQAAFRQKTAGPAGRDDSKASKDRPPKVSGAMKALRAVRQKKEEAREARRDEPKSEQKKSSRQASLGKPEEQKNDAGPRQDNKDTADTTGTGCGSKDPKIAIPACSAKIDAGEKTAAVYHVRGRAYLESGQPDPAIADFDRVFGLKPDSAIAFQTHFWRAQAHWGKKQLAEAMKDYDAVLALRPDYAMGYYGRGRLHRETGQTERALADFNEALRLDPRHYGALLYRGFAYSDMGQYGRAIADYDAVIKIRPKTAQAYNSRAVAYFRLGQYDRALKDFDAAIAINPKDALARNNREKLLKMLASSQNKKGARPPR